MKITHRELAVFFLVTWIVSGAVFDYFHKCKCETTQALEDKESIVDSTVSTSE